jgi:uncharacterized membrane protein YtjA (UPF0391 family)
LPRPETGCGAGCIAAGAAGIAKILFFLFLIAFVVSLVMHFMRGRGPGSGPDPLP